MEQETLYNILTGRYGEILETHAMWECISALDIKPFKDGNQWCFLYGNNIQDGICGFGKTIFKAAWDFYTNIKTEEARAEHKRLIGGTEERMTKLMSKPASLDSIVPYWDEELKGVVIPLIGKVLHVKCLGEADWEGAKKLAKEAGGELFSKNEGYILAYYKDEINELMEAHGGDKLEDWNWCSSEHSALHAWTVNFGSGCINNHGKSSTIYVRAVSAL